jgi:uncharacterized membrane protein YraQ (UPF0718 family)
MKFSPSTGTKKSLGMAILYIILPLFLLWYFFVHLKIVRFDVADIIIIALLFGLVLYVYNGYRKKLSAESAPVEEMAVEEAPFEEEIEEESMGEEAEPAKEEAEGEPEKK